MRSHNDSIDTTHTPPPLSFYNTFKFKNFGTGDVQYPPEWLGRYDNAFGSRYIDWHSCNEGLV